MDGAIAACSAYGPARRSAAQRSTSAGASAIARGPSAAVLVGEQHELAVGVGARVAARVVEQHEREQADRLGLVGHQLDEQAAEPDRLGAQVARATSASPRVAV